MRGKKVIHLLLCTILCLSLFLPSTAIGQASETVNPYYEQEAVATGNGGAVATEHPLASKAAIEIMEKGGNAVDAAIAAAAVQNVTRPFSGGIGGGGMMSIFLAEENKNVTLTHRSMAPASFNIESFEDENGNIYDYDQRKNSGRAVGVPGSVLAWEEALENYGTMTLAEVLQPAIKAASEGFTIDENFVREVRENASRFRMFTSTSELFLDEDGNIPPAGTLLKNPDLARTFQLIGEYGSDVFYKGEIGKAILDAVNNPPAKENTPYEILPADMTWEDLASYEVVTGDAVTTSYRGFNVHGMPLVSSGGLLIGEILNILENYDLENMSQTEFLHYYLEASKRGFADRAEFHGDPTVIDVPTNGLISKNFALSRQQTITDKATVGKVAPGDAWFYEQNPNHVPEPLPELEPGLTYQFEGKAGDSWDKEKFFVDTSFDTSYTFDGNGFGKLAIGDRRNSAGRASSEMVLVDNKELLVPFKINDIGPNRYLRIWLRADGFNRSASPHNGYGVEIRSGWNNIRLIKTVDSNQIEEIARFNRTLSSDLQWLRFKVVDDQLSVKVWSDGEEEPVAWNLIEEDVSISEPGRLLISSIEFADGNGGGSFSLGEMEIVETNERTPTPDDLEPGFEYEFSGEEGETWDSSKFETDTTGDGIIDLAGNGFGRMILADKDRSSARATAIMKPTTDSELLVPFRMDAGPSRDLRFWLRADQFSNLQSPLNGYGVDIRTEWNSIRLIKTVNGSTPQEIARFNLNVTEDLQWLRFRVEGNQLFVKVWKDGKEEPANWNLVEEDHSVMEPGLLLISAREYRTGEGAGNFYIGNMKVEDLEEVELEPGFESDFRGVEGETWDSSKFETDTTEDGIIDLAGNGFGRMMLADKDRSSARATAKMSPANDSELLVPFRMDVSPSRDLRFWLRADQFNNLQSPLNGYGVDIRTAWNSIRLIKTVNGTLQEIGRFSLDVTEDLQWLRFRVEGDQQFIKVWQDGQEEPSEWNLIEQDTSVNNPGRLLISAREYRNGEGAGSFYIGNIIVTDLQFEGDDEQDPTEGAPGNSETIHLTVADSYGNVVAYTNTIVSIGGSGIVVPGYGFMLNDVLANRVRYYADEGEPNSAHAGAKPLSTMAPTIITKDGEAVFAGGAPGSLTIISTVTQIILSYLDRGMSLPDAVEMARISQQNKISGVTIIEPAFSETKEYEELKALGHKFEVSPLVQGIGAFTGIAFLPDGQKQAVAEAVRRGGGSAMTFDLPTLIDIKEQIQALNTNDGIKTSLLKQIESAEKHFKRAAELEASGEAKQAEKARELGYDQLKKVVEQINKTPDHLISEEEKVDLSSKLEYMIKYRTVH
ncbi:gamma-glutamyltransferase [Sutcliffiella sp. NC1]|uniref:gamma-glutamyltransferase n=1 Tax=Sutcliffiella sp. NC1 TaxID=3004096 RepID=UPI0022DE8ECB|nr:gamma-glutamyltransferase [Sutcliffiella sp. NC1]WBL16617.1 gamma-glutamyltransferase [Sutcliffiella sp. NC1]